ncbi:hypothetical protein K0M31_008727 [Melipona bicolor]|uniref:Uncharacterized protein n=1 Tax=Melipona bicolor TaxID=60889 RepID=A0AA40FPP9_9HYME|nr:hypothetical protein K0M31_008727 [Melipona bicolor]
MKPRLTGREKSLQALKFTRARKIPRKRATGAGRQRQRTIKPTTRREHRFALWEKSASSSLVTVTRGDDRIEERYDGNGKNSAETEKCRGSLPSGRPTTRCGSSNTAIHCADVATTTTSSPRRPRDLSLFSSLMNEEEKEEEKNEERRVEID